jgi:hypothetical protein
MAILLVQLLTVAAAEAQSCPGSTLISDLRRPMGLALSNQVNLLVSETGTATPHSGRLSIVDPSGNRRTLLDRLPSGLNDIAEPSGPAGIAMRGRTLYVLMSIGDSVLPAPVPTRHLPNPNVSSPIFSSVLAIHFSANVENSTLGFTLSVADQQTLAAGGKVILSNGGGDSIEIELVTNFPDHVPDPLPGFPAIVRGSNPFGIAVSGNDLYATDGGRNLVWHVDRATGSFSALATFPTIPNPLPVGGPVVEAVPTGIDASGGHLLVTLFRGVPFPPGSSTVVRIDPSTGQQAPLISGLKTAIGVFTTRERGDVSFLVLQHSSGAAPFFPGPGLVLQFDAPGGAPTVLADCLARPTSMTLDAKQGRLYVAELVSGRLVALQLGS